MREWRNATHWPKHLLLHYSWLVQHEEDEDYGLLVLFSGEWAWRGGVGRTALSGCARRGAQHGSGDHCTALAGPSQAHTAASVHCIHPAPHPPHPFCALPLQLPPWRRCCWASTWRAPTKTSCVPSWPTWRETRAAAAWRRRPRKRVTEEVAALWPPCNCIDGHPGCPHCGHVVVLPWCCRRAPAGRAAEGSQLPAGGGTGCVPQWGVC